MIYKLCNGGLSVVGTRPDGATVSCSIEAPEYKQWVLDGGIPEPEFTAAELLDNTKALKMQELENTFINASNLPIAVGTKTYNGGKESASSIMGGVELANLNLETSIEIWDINNEIAIYSIMEAMHIVKTIALDYRVKILAKQAKVTQVNAIIVDPIGQYQTYESAIAALNLI